VVSVKAWIEPIIPDCLDVSVRTEREGDGKEKDKREKEEKERAKERG